MPGTRRCTLHLTNPLTALLSSLALARAPALAPALYLVPVQVLHQLQEHQGRQPGRTAVLGTD